jgi:hypothetical protein
MNNFNQRFQKEMDKGLKELMDDIQWKTLIRAFQFQNTSMKH